MNMSALGEINSTNRSNNNSNNISGDLHKDESDDGDSDEDDNDSNLPNAINLMHLINDTAPCVDVNTSSTSLLGACKKILNPSLMKKKRANHEELNLSGSEGKLSKYRPMWKKLLKKSTSLDDPWENLGVISMPTEEVKRFRYDPSKQKWTEDFVKVRIEEKSFGQGAMRECFRLKKLSTTTKRKEWNHRANNFVAKSYISPVDKSVYFEDVKLQMDAKLWANHYNRQAEIIRKVDIVQMAVIEFVNRENSPLFHMESFFSGDYIKYNSNSGFVEVEGGCRNTPNAFSHFTFEHSGHSLIVVDIQGVGDLYTDPQIHTVSGKEYGDGNLGTRGMALFFHSHKCNRLCKVLGLSSFSISNEESSDLESLHNSNKSSAIRSETEAAGSFQPMLIKPRTRNITFSHGDDHQGPPQRLFSLNESAQFLNVELPHSFNDSSFLSSSGQDSSFAPSESNNGGRSKMSESSDSCGFSPFSSNTHISSIFKRRKSNFVVDTDDFFAVNEDTEILSKVHHDMALLHISGRFLKNKEIERIDWNAVYFHERIAAEFGFREAVRNMYNVNLGLPTDIFNESSEFTKFNLDLNAAIAFLKYAISLDDRIAMILLASLFDRTASFIESLEQEKLLPEDWDQAASLYERAITIHEITPADSFCSGIVDIMPIYELKAKLAFMYGQGGPNLEKDIDKSYELYYEAADDAILKMKGKLANSYYEAAESLS